MQGDGHLARVQSRVGAAVDQQKDIIAGLRLDGPGHLPRPHLDQRGVDFRGQLTLLDPSQVTAHGGGCALREVAGQGAKAGARLQLLHQALGEEAGFLFVLPFVYGEKNFHHPVFGLSLVGFDLGQHLVDLVFADPHPDTQPAVHRLGPHDPGFDLVDQHHHVDAIAFQEGRQATAGQAVLPLDPLQGPVDVFFRRPDAQSPRLLKLELVVDESAQHLRRQTAPGLGLVAHPRGHQRQRQPRVEVIGGNDVVVDHRRDTQRILRPGAAAKEQRRQQ